MWPHCKWTAQHPVDSLEGGGGGGKGPERAPPRTRLLLRTRPHAIPHPIPDSFPPRHALSMSCPTQETPLPGHGPPGPTLLQALPLSGFWSHGEPDTNRCPEGWGAAPELGKEARKFWKLPTERQVGLLPLRTRQLRAPPDLSTPFKKPTTRTNILQFPLLQLLHSLCLNY